MGRNCVSCHRICLAPEIHGNKERFLDALERSVDEHSTLAAFLPGMPTYYMPELEKEPRFQALLERIGYSG